jgi:hypothetical protein
MRYRPMQGAVLLLAGCVGTTGGEIVTFDVAAAGPVGARQGQPLAFLSGRGFQVVLSRATLEVGAIYLNQSLPVSGAQATSCILPGTYVAEARRGRQIDLLDGELQPFPEPGTGTTTAAQAAEVWLTGGDVNAPDDPTPVLQLEGVADRDGKVYPFSATITIGKNRLSGSIDVAQPGADPICKQRIVSPIPTDITPQPSGRLIARIDPRALFTNTDFSALQALSEDPPRYVFADGPANQPSVSLYQALRSTALYQFEWSSE